ncbi:MAG: methyl-accepting chemotaxis protein [Caloramator sp.]|jgi:methyl-accepting chemotaxis protein|uniref:MCP four helix bundle domain-containing protein n=1 Tax=Caloramator sp. TaxID=1871330 RepID=UPI001D9E994F|nr:MCP four helix bundle domain-containing protein [Caloramator sp.]MBZ4663875.1 methyl-accepting chemotaxis protein [Caloramator sp.]
MLEKLGKKPLINKLKIRSILSIKLLLNVLVIIAIITSLITSMEGLRNLNNTNNALFSMYSDIVMPTDYIQNINSSFFEMRINAYKAFRLNVFKEYDKNYNINVQNLYKDIVNKISEYEKKKCTNEEKQLIEQLKNDISDYMKVWQQYNETMEKKEEINDLFKFNTVGNKTQNTINELIKINRDIAKGIYEKNQYNFKLTLIREIVIIVLGITLLLLISIKIIKTMVRELKEINEIIYELSNANFNIKFKSEGNNEFSKMKKLLEEMSAKVSSLIKNVKISTENLSKNSSELSAISEEMALSTQELSKQCKMYRKVHYHREINLRK